MPSSTNYAENVINTLTVEYFEPGNTDIDLCCAIKSKVFIQ
jgi:hypothetical protein